MKDISWDFSKDPKREKLRPNDGDGYVCDWCKMAYPVGGHDYYQLVLFGRKLKTICSDCYNHLHHIKAEDQERRRK